MKVFWVLLLVLLKTIGNQGVLNNPVNESLSYIVSVRNMRYCHTCTGSIISKNWVLSHNACLWSPYISYGLRFFKDCSNEPKYMFVNITNWKHQNTSVLLLQVGEDFDSNLKTLDLPAPSCFSCELFKKTKGAVVGWSKTILIRNIVMIKIDNVHFEKAFSGEDETFFNKFTKMEGSPLIAKNVVYGIVKSIYSPFYNISEDLVWINQTMSQKPIN